MPDWERSVVNRVINGGRFVGPHQEAGETPLFVTLFATRSVDAEATTARATASGRRAVGESIGRRLPSPGPALRAIALKYG